jgi:hypothetical protein
MAVEAHHGKIAAQGRYMLGGWSQIFELLEDDVRATLFERVLNHRAL